MNRPIEMFQRWRTLTSHRIHRLPVLVLMPHEGCNCRCDSCNLWQTDGSKKEISQMDLQLQMEGLRRLRVRRVVLSGGEPLLHGDLWGLCELLERVGAKITLLSNGLLLRHQAREAVRWCDQAIVSLDGTPPTHDALRGIPGCFDRLAEGISALKTAAPGFRITARCVLQRRNFRELPEIVDAAHQIGLDQISFLAVDVSSAAFNRSVPWTPERVDGAALAPAEVVEFEETLESTVSSHDSDFHSGFIAESPDKLRRLGRYFAALNGYGDFPPPHCNAPWVSAVMEADGTVRPCFFHRPLGQLRDRPLEAVLNSEEAIAFRRQLDTRRDPICRQCVCTLYVGHRARP